MSLTNVGRRLFCFKKVCCCGRVNGRVGYKLMYKRAKYLNNKLLRNNSVNYTKESYKEKEQILTDFVFTTEKKVLCKNIPVRNPVPVRKVS